MSEKNIEKLNEAARHSNQENPVSADFKFNPAENLAEGQEPKVIYNMTESGAKCVAYYDTQSAVWRAGDYENPSIHDKVYANFKELKKFIGQEYQGINFPENLKEAA